MMPSPVFRRAFVGIFSATFTTTASTASATASAGGGGASSSSANATSGASSVAGASLATTNRRDLRVDDGVKVKFFTQMIRAARVLVHGIGYTRMNQKR